MKITKNQIKFESKLLKNKDVITGSSLDDQIFSGKGNDQVRGGAGDDLLVPGHDFVHGVGEGGGERSSGLLQFDPAAGADEVLLVAGVIGDVEAGGEWNWVASPSANSNPLPLTVLT